MSGLPIASLRLPQGLRRFFANPRGVVARRPEPLISGAPMAVCVGDYVSRFCVGLLGPARSSIIYDGRTRRGATKPPQAAGYRVVRVVNPPGGLTPSAVLAACRAAREPGLAVEVEGEEDMMALPALACSMPGGLVLYGLPGRGTVVVRVDEGVAADALERMLHLTPGSASQTF